MAFTVVPYQSLTYRNEASETAVCRCPQPVYIDSTADLNVQVGLSPFDGIDIFTDYVTALTVDNLTESPAGTFCYDRAANTPYVASITIDISEGGPGDGGMSIDTLTQINFSYTSNVLFYCTLELYGQTGPTLISTQTFELPAALAATDVTKYVFSDIFDAAGYTVVITFYASTVDSTASFCFSALTGYTMSHIGAVKWVDCDGDITDITAGVQVSFFGDRELLTIDITSLSGQGYLQLLDINDANIKQYSSLFEAINPNTYGLCRLGKLTKILWREACNLQNGTVAYTSIEYSLYISGYAERLPLVTDERITFTEPGGRKRTIFNYSYAPVFLKVGVYDIDTHENLERAVESSYFAINDVEHQLDSGSTYAIASLNNGLFTARVDMIKVGTERILTDCCCPVVVVEDTCGCLTITEVCIVATLRLIKYDLCGLTTGTDIDVQFENIDAIEDSPCAVAANTTYTETSVDTLGGAANAVSYSAADFQAVFDNEYCGYTNIRYYIRIRVNCGATQGEWSDPIVIVPDNLEVCG